MTSESPAPVLQHIQSRAKIPQISGEAFFNRGHDIVHTGNTMSFSIHLLISYCIKSSYYNVLFMTVVSVQTRMHGIALKHTVHWSTRVLWDETEWKIRIKSFKSQSPMLSGLLKLCCILPDEMSPSRGFHPPENRVMACSRCHFRCVLDFCRMKPPLGPSQFILEFPPIY